MNGDGMDDVVVGPPGDGGLCRDTVSRSVMCVGDINGDGFEDLVEGYPDASRCLVHLGSSNGFRNMAVSFTVEGDGGDGFGWSLAGVGDWNQDGLDDFVVCGKEGFGYCSVIYGRRVFPDQVTVSGLGWMDGFRIVGGASIFSMGIAVAGAKDFNGDGLRDLVISALDSTWQSVVYVLIGPLLSLEAGSGSGGPAVMSLDDAVWRSSVLKVVFPVNSFAGYWVAGIGDLNNDGFDDIAVSSIPFRGGYSTQRAYVIFGRRVGTKAGGGVNNSVSEWEEVDVSRMMMGKDGFTIVGAGFSVSEVGDVNKDGIADLMVSSYYDWHGGSNAYLVSLPINVSSPPTFFPSSVPSWSPAQSPTSFPSLLTALDNPTTRPDIFTAGPTPRFNESSPPTTIRVTSSFPSLGTRAPVMKKTVTPTRTPSSFPPSLSPSFRPSRIPTSVPYLETAVPNILVPLTRPPRTNRPTISPTHTTAPTAYQTIQWSGTSFTVLHCPIAGDYYGTLGHQNFIITGTGVIHIVSRPVGSGGGDVKVFSLSPMANEVIVENFDVHSDIIDLLQYDVLASVEDLSYSSNPLRIFLWDPSTGSPVSPSRTGVSTASSSRSLLRTLDTSSGESSQQSIVLSDLKDMHALSARNFLFIATVSTSDASSSDLEGLISFGLVMLGAVFVVVFANFRQEEVDEESNQKKSKMNDAVVNKPDIEESGHIHPETPHSIQGDQLIIRVLKDENRKGEDDRVLDEECQNSFKSDPRENNSISSSSDSSSSSSSGYEGDDTLDYAEGNDGVSFSSLSSEREIKALPSLRGSLQSRSSNPARISSHPLSPSGPPLSSATDMNGEDDDTGDVEEDFSLSWQFSDDESG